MYSSSTNNNCSNWYEETTELRKKIFVYEKSFEKGIHKNKTNKFLTAKQIVM